MHHQAATPLCCRSHSRAFLQELQLPAERQSLQHYHVYAHQAAVCKYYARHEPPADAQVQDLSRLIEAMGQDPFAKRYRKLSAAVADIIEDFGLVAFQLLAIEDKNSVARVLALADKAIGYVFAGLAKRNPYPAELEYGPRAVDSGVGGLWNKHQRDQDVTISERET